MGHINQTAQLQKVHVVYHSLLHGPYKLPIQSFVDPVIIKVESYLCCYKMIQNFTNRVHNEAYPGIAPNKLLKASIYFNLFKHYKLIVY